MEALLRCGKGVRWHRCSDVDEGVRWRRCCDVDGGVRVNNLAARSDQKESLRDPSSTRTASRLRAVSLSVNKERETGDTSGDRVHLARMEIAFA